MEQWGGIAYSLAAFSAACPEGWQIVPIAKLGEDLAEQGFSFIGRLPNIGSLRAVQLVPHPNNRVELRYHDSAERSERLSGGVTPWSVEELLPIVRDLDALYVNFISGFELGLQAVLGLRGSADLPIYADLHSLFLGPADVSPREPRALPEWRRWFEAFDLVQLNASELSLLGHSAERLSELAHELRGPWPRGVLVTRGALGAEVLRRSPFRELDSRHMDSPSDAAWQVEHIELPHPAVEGDPTGCGDVWGSVVVCGLLERLPLPVAIRRAHRAAAAKMHTSRIERLPEAVSAALARSGPGV